MDTQTDIETEVDTRTPEQRAAVDAMRDLCRVMPERTHAEVESVYAVRPAAPGVTDLYNAKQMFRVYLRQNVSRSIMLMDAVIECGSTDELQSTVRHLIRFYKHPENAMWDATIGQRAMESVTLLRKCPTAKVAGGVL